MKIIDLLNKIANGEEVPKKVYVGNCYFEYEDNGEYINIENETDLLFDFDSYYQLETCLNQEVEILEEEKKIPEKLKAISNKGDYKIIYPTNEILTNKINEIIDYLISKGE